MSEHNGKCRLLTSHGAVLFYLAHNPSTTMVAAARDIGITERRTHDIIADLKKQGLIEVSRNGRRNVYSVKGKSVPSLDRQSNPALNLLVDLVETDRHAD
jgi:DNA-binding MarR family transcriptional regulator